MKMPVSCSFIFPTSFTPVFLCRIWQSVQCAVPTINILLRPQGEMWRQLEAQPDPGHLLAWLQATVSSQQQEEPAFISALLSVVIRCVRE